MRRSAVDDFGATQTGAGVTPNYGPWKALMRRAFTLIELMVVVAIIGLLVAMLMPALSKARAQSRLAVCATNLHQIGVATRAYINDNRDRLPYASLMPSLGPAPLSTKQPIYIADVLGKEVGNPEVFHCPNDQPGGVRPAPNEGKSYFESERSSYEFRFQLGGMTTQEAANRFSQFTDRTVAENTIWILRDYDNFHGPAGKPAARRYLYIDGHVADYEN